MLKCQAKVSAPLLCCVVLMCGLLSCGGDLRESHYRTLAHARSDGALQRGWIPDIVPETSHDIHELHDVSAGTTWCALQFDKRDADSFRAALGPSAVAPIKRVGNPRVSWWPPVLTGELDVDRIRTAGLELHWWARPDVEEAIMFAIDRSGGRAFFYRVPR